MEEVLTLNNKKLSFRSRTFSLIELKKKKPDKLSQLILLWAQKKVNSEKNTRSWLLNMIKYNKI